MRRRVVTATALSLLLLALSLLAGCTWLRPGPSTTGFPKAPAACAGPPRDGHYEAFRTGAWREAERSVDAAADGAAARATRATEASAAGPDPADTDPGPDLWFSFARTITPEEVASITAGLDVVGSMIVYPSNGGLYGKAIVPLEPGPDVAAAVRAGAQRYLATTLDSTDPATIRSRTRLLAGDVPVGGVRARGRAKAVSSFVRDHRCLIYGTMLGRNDALPPISAAVDPT